MQELSTVYQDMNTKEILAEIKGALVYIAQGTTVSRENGGFYEVKYIEDVIRDEHSVSRIIWVEQH